MASPYLHEWLFWHAAHVPDAPAVADATTRLTYRDLAARVRALAGHLQADGVGPGSRVLVALPNSLAAIVSGLAVLSLGATSVEVSREWATDVLTEIIVRSRVSQAVLWYRDTRRLATALSGEQIDRVWIMHREELPAASADALPSVPMALLLEDGRVDPGLGAAPLPATSECRPDWPALVLYTSGSTGRPHGVIQTFGNIDANSRAIVKCLGLTSTDRALVTLPLSYCYGRSVLQTHLLVGGSLYLDNRMAFPRVVLETLASEQCTGFAGVPLTFEMIRRKVDVTSIAFSDLRYVTQAGGAMAPGTIAWARDAFAPAQLLVMYGQTEATARLSCLPPERAADKSGSIGRAIPGVDLRVVDGSGRELAPGKVGELVASGANVTPGYLDEPEETAAIIRGDWLWTGDLAMKDADGFLFLRGRAKEILKVGGHRVSPVEIEHVIMCHPDVIDVAVLGVPDDMAGEVPGAVIVGRRGAPPSEADLRRFCRERLPPYQVPVSFALVGSLPRNESGKLLRAQLATSMGTD
ncbi:MAG: class I adenylate-forming enzyme family protein [Chloroflexota bacterium]